jgi:cyclophilin family peptidyl-prolyl cis-trans isomerase
MLKRKNGISTLALWTIPLLLLATLAGCAPSTKTVLPTLAPGAATPTKAVPTLDPNAPTLIPIDDDSMATRNAATAAARPTRVSSAPPMTIDATRQYFAVFRLAKGGQFTAQLFPDKAPITVNNFVTLARSGFYNGATFHRVLSGFMAQGGDPTGTGMGGPGYEFQNEDNDLKFDKAGALAMANAGRDTNGSQFFITFGPAEWLNGDYTIFGQVIEGMEAVLSITLRDPEQNPNYPGDVIESIIIEENPSG